MKPFEIDYGSGATINPLFSGEIPSFSKIVRTETSSTNLTKFSRLKVFLLALLLSSSYTIATLIGMLLSLNLGDNVDSIVSSLTILQLMLLTSSFSLGGAIVMMQIRCVKGACALACIVAVTLVVTFVVGEVPMIENDTSIVTNENDGRNGCVLFSQGFGQYSQSVEIFDKINEMCPSIANSNRFHKLNDKFLSIGLNIDGYLTYAKTIYPFLYSLMEYSKNSEIQPLMCKASFPVCNPTTCSTVNPCHFFSDNWFQLSLCERQRIMKEQLEAKAFRKSFNQIMEFVSTEFQADLLRVYLETLTGDIVPILEREWQNIADRNSSCVFNMSLAADKYACNPTRLLSLPTKTERDQADNRHKRAEAITARKAIAISFAFLVIATVTLVSTFYANYLPFWLREHCGKKYLKLYSSLIFGWLVVLFVSALSTFGGSLLDKERGKKGIAATYYLISLFILAGFNVVLSNADATSDEKRDGALRNGSLTSCLKSKRCACIVLFQRVSGKLKQHPIVKFLLNCLNPRRPEYLYRLVIAEIIEVFLQLGAAVFPQMLNGGIVMVSVVIISVNVAATVTIIVFMAPSPLRVAILLVVEILSDGFFMFYGIIRLRSNLDIYFIEHLALIKPILTLSLDSTDLFIIEQLEGYQSDQLAITSKANRLETGGGGLGGIQARGSRREQERKSRSGRQRVVHFDSSRFLNITIILFAMGVTMLAAVTVAKYESIRSKCAEEVGPIAACLQERYYFNVERGILGKPSCNFGNVTKVLCSRKNIDKIPSIVGVKMKNVTDIDLSNNGLLQTIPASLARMPALRSLNLSHTGLETLPFEIANATQVKTLDLTATPVNTNLNWSHKNLVAMPSTDSIFYETFSNSLNVFDISNNPLLGDAILSRLCRLTNLRALNVSFVSLTILGSNGCNLLEDFPLLKHLDAEGNNISQLVITESSISRSISRASLLQNAYLETILLDKVGNTAKHTRAYLEKFTLPLNTLRSIVLVGCSFQRSKDFLPWPKSFSSIRRFDGTANELRGGALVLFHDLPNVEEIYLHVAKIQGDIGELSSVTSLKHIEMNGNNLTGDFSTLKNLPLSHLEIGNSFRFGSEINVTAIETLTQLEYIYLNSNPMLVGAFPKLIGQLTRLTHLDISTCGVVGEVPAQVSKLISLSHIDVSYNKGLNVNLSAFKNLSKLVSLGLDEIALSKKWSASIGKLTKLTYLSLGATNISGDIGNTFKNMKGLSVLKLGRNQFSGDLSPFSELYKLTRLHLNHNAFEGTLEWIKGLMNLEDLKLQGNHLNMNGTKLYLKNLTKLETADIDISYDRYDPRSVVGLDCG